jgi:hypothetical protein
VPGRAAAHGKRRNGKRKRHNGHRKTGERVDLL